MFLKASGGRLRYEDRNYEGRAGWKEIVIAPGPGAHLKSASQTGRDRSQALTAYPPDPMAAPPQDLRAALVWAADAPSAAAAPPTTTAAPPAAAAATTATASSGRPGAQEAPPSAPLIQAIPQPAARPAPPASSITAKNAPAGAVVKNDFLSRLLRRQEIPLTMVLAALAVAFALGAAHALTPGHGKTIVAAYLVGSRGTLKHAAFLGAMVTFTHTISVFALGLATLFLFRSVVPEKVAGLLGIISGLSIVAIGGWMFWKRVRALPGRHTHTHTHEHPHGHGHEHSHEHSHGHQHGPGGHTHLPEGDITWGSLAALAVSGGLVPCESALVLLLSAISLGRAGLGLLLLVAFSLGLAGVLVTIGAVVVYTKQALPERARAGRSPWFRWAPIASGAIVILVGVIMTSVSLGWLSTRWLIG
jgi:nickel/cobalt exporter